MKSPVLFTCYFEYAGQLCACPLTSLERAKRQADTRPLGHVVEYGTGRVVYLPTSTKRRLARQGLSTDVLRAALSLAKSGDDRALSPSFA